jgi:hypothetical protein
MRRGKRPAHRMKETARPRAVSFLFLSFFFPLWHFSCSPSVCNGIVFSRNSLNPGGIVRKILFVLMLLSLAGCKKSAAPDSGQPSSVDANDGTLPDVPPPPPEADRTPCPEGTEMKGGPPPDSKEEWCQRPDGTLHGRSTVWHPNRYKAAEGEYRENLKEGKWTYWHPDGTKASEGEYQAGKRHGAWTFWHTSGEKSEEGEFQQGLEHGTWKHWDEEGKPLPDEEYDKGMRIRR